VRKRGRNSRRRSKGRQTRLCVGKPTPDMVKGATAKLTGNADLGRSARRDGRERALEESKERKASRAKAQLQLTCRFSAWRTSEKTTSAQSTSAQLSSPRERVPITCNNAKRLLDLSDGPTAPDTAVPVLLQLYIFADYRSISYRLHGLAGILRPSQRVRRVEL
jgi:hypothetical protein